MEKLLNKFQSLKDKQNELMILMSKEDCKDIHSVLRAKSYADGIIELEIKIEILKDIIVEYS